MEHKIPKKKRQEMFCLGIESTCDDTSIALVKKNFDGKGSILSLLHSGQEHLYKRYGGVVPELAARAHVQQLGILLEEMLIREPHIPKNLDGIAVSGGPGLIGGLMAGVMLAKALAMEWKRPFLAINHLEAHGLTVRLTEHVPFPYLLLLISGGHTELVAMLAYRHYIVLVRSRDDAAGESFDKAARLLQIPVPTGANLEQCAKQGRKTSWNFPRPLLHSKKCAFSFSGLKTALSLEVNKCMTKHGKLPQQERHDMAAEFQCAMIDCLVDRTMLGMKNYEKMIRKDKKYLVVSGGVAANMQVRSSIANLSQKQGYTCIIPPTNLCTDNGAMVAWCGLEALAHGESTSLDFLPRSRWSLQEIV